MRCGSGQAISPTVKPDGRAHSTRGGSPESPGFTQYVCQPGEMRWYRATQKGCPGATPPTSLTSSTRTRRPSGSEVAGEAAGVPAVTREQARTRRVLRRLIAGLIIPFGLLRSQGLPGYLTRGPSYDV